MDMLARHLYRTDIRFFGHYKTDWRMDDAENRQSKHISWSVNVNCNDS